MNYNDQILENKTFNFFKQLMYNIALSICILLIGLLLMVYGFGFKLYEVTTGSEEPYLPIGCMVIVKAKDEYQVGDILTFKQPIGTVTHRLIATYEKNGVKYYLCHGDNNESANPDSETHLVPWQEDSAYVQGLIDQHGSYGEIPNGEIKNVQLVPESDAIGVVVNHIDNLGSIVTFIKEHYMLVIAIVAGFWCISNVLQNEIEIKKSRRLE